METSENTWGNILIEFDKLIEEANIRSAQEKKPIKIDFDIITQKYIDRLFQITKRPILIVIYKTYFQKPREMCYLKMGHSERI